MKPLAEFFAHPCRERNHRGLGGAVTDGDVKSIGSVVEIRRGRHLGALLMLLPHRVMLEWSARELS